jgi:hypothetical protein
MFWTRVLSNPKQQMDRPASKDYVREPHAGLCEAMLGLLGGKVTKEQQTAFGEALRSSLQALPERTGAYFLGTDYHPDRILADALVVAGISDNMGTLPIKTKMWLAVSGKGVDVAYGYGAKQHHCDTVEEMDAYLKAEGH